MRQGSSCRKMYQALAKIYDQVMTRVDYSAWADFVWQAHSMLSLPFPKRALDLASGTGSVALEMAKLGADVLAIDQSMSMLELGKERGKTLGLLEKIRFQQADLESWQGPKESFDFAWCACDGLNYLCKAGIAHLLEELAALLAPDSLFIFDLNTPFKYREIFANNVFAENFPDFSYIWENELQENSCHFKLTIFLKEGQLFRRYQEHHIQYIYSLEEMAELIADFGFSWRGVFDSYSWREPVMETERWTIIAQR